MYNLRLYIIGGTLRATKSIENLETILEADFKDYYSLEVIDVLKNPKLAEEDKILATPR
jgi:circadian clock protein KaiB